ncbi:MAG: NADH:ubiquinone reductase (Na(+)-transporting) subunit B [Candidatus Marinimicrobia bacterium]|jgi:Na+-transporting NADH:ubiquinone oxidoreductase subunit B|nr:NADH:ubiquinone reductase (Na(+)-transporting) subunit B [Candidatus Neomarinimicrobiota bacterium]MBT3495679.1 NADH:ubiquinone reductase (Na(+)-transporting) subunit B [Candidatus Neomarinimicrobiota bacterium]MBT3693108.1 NADH:ubiquinone reductase (Na(+)-transporting) subunit B [Candidatus Neomarinimicrobiota bacterium]MBT3731545.1 NADH:ubiquinone reductase (Na(+)-transporting) subunit B [Candidatus Neomarinimicrobiota bacterium]MBT4143997.1 NADH:ubiquinone reductase (Na(+)-transporting) s
MKSLRNIMNKIAPVFEEKGKLEKLYPLWEAIDVGIFNSNKKTNIGPHIRDSVDIKRVMIMVVFALLPLYIFGAINIGVQSGIAQNVSQTWNQNFVIGIKILLPIFLVTFITGGLWEVIFASVRKHDINEGFFVTGFLIPLIVPPTIPLWQVAVATTFGVVIGKEIFGGTGYNIFNPALTARAFIFFAYPGAISGDKVWVSGVDGYSGATGLSIPAAVEGGNAKALLDGVTQFDYSWWNMFVGWIPGSIGETSKILILLAGLFLILTKIASWRIMAGGLLGLFATAWLTNSLSSYSTNTMLSLPPEYHLVMGGFLFGLVFMATDPVSAAQTNKGRWIYGFCIGAMTIIIRSINPAYPEGTMLAILFMNAFSPLIDYFVVKGNIKKRMVRYAK